MVSNSRIDSKLQVPVTKGLLTSWNILVLLMKRGDGQKNINKKGITQIQSHDLWMEFFGPLNLF